MMRKVRITCGVIYPIRFVFWFGRVRSIGRLDVRRGGRLIAMLLLWSIASLNNSLDPSSVDCFHCYFYTIFSSFISISLTFSAMIISFDCLCLNAPPWMYVFAILNKFYRLYVIVRTYSRNWMPFTLTMAKDTRCIFCTIPIRILPVPCAASPLGRIGHLLTVFFQWGTSVWYFQRIAWR